MLYDDPVTIPAGDIADNPYWKRDSRRAYPTLSFVNQGDAVALLGVGSAAAPKQELVGEAGEKALAVAREAGQQKGLAEFFEEKGKQGVMTAAADLFVNGLPPMPSGQALKADNSGAWEVKDYELLEDQSYGDGCVFPLSIPYDIPPEGQMGNRLANISHRYPCRTFK